MEAPLGYFTLCTGTRWKQSRAPCVPQVLSVWLESLFFSFPQGADWQRQLERSPVCRYHWPIAFPRQSCGFCRGLLSPSGSCRPSDPRACCSDAPCVSSVHLVFRVPFCFVSLAKAATPCMQLRAWLSDIELYLTTIVRLLRGQRLLMDLCVLSATVGIRVDSAVAEKDECAIRVFLATCLRFWRGSSRVALSPAAQTHSRVLGDHAVYVAPRLRLLCCYSSIAAALLNRSSRSLQISL